MSRIMLARMSTLEEGFREVLNEVREWRKDGIRTMPATAPGSVGSVGSVEGIGVKPTKGRGKRTLEEDIAHGVAHADFGAEYAESSSV